MTNALTGWAPPSERKAPLALFPALETERDQAEHVKRDVSILVVQGNPPCNAFPGTSPEEEEAGLHKLAPKALGNVSAEATADLSPESVRTKREK